MKSALLLLCAAAQLFVVMKPYQQQDCYRREIAILSGGQRRKIWA
jgi:hypothetical protein